LSRSGGLAALVVIGLAAAAPAQAAPDKRAREAAQLYQQGKYQEAAELYTKLRDEKQNPKFLCNLALCYLKMGYLDPGVETIKQCLDTAALNPDTRTGYEALLARLEARRAAVGQPQEVVVPPAVDVNLVAVPEAGAPYPGGEQDPAAGAGVAGAAVAAPAWGVPPGDPASAAGTVPAGYAEAAPVGQAGA
jgi:tetratricopeptide (TPR) repeat protein